MVSLCLKNPIKLSSLCPKVLCKFQTVSIILFEKIRPIVRNIINIIAIVYKLECLEWLSLEVVPSLHSGTTIVLVLPRAFEFQNCTDLL